MSENCTLNNQLLTPCDSLGKAIGSVNVDLSKIGTSRIGVYQYTDEEGIPIRDVVFVISSQGDNTPMPLKYCPFCRTSIETTEV